MKKIIIFIVVLLILVTAGYLFVKKNPSTKNLLNLSGCEIKENLGEIVPVNIAQMVAQKQVNENNKPFSWVSVGYYPIYGSSGLIKYYAFVFRRSDYIKFTTLNSLEQNAANYSSDSSNNDNKYQFNDIASIWTGAHDGQKLIMRHYRGIPEIVAERINLEKFIEDKYSGKTIGNIIADSEAGKMYYEIINKTDKRSTNNVVGLDYAVSSKSDLVKYQDGLENRTLRRNNDLNKQQCESLKQAYIDREADFKKQWAEFGN